MSFSLGRFWGFVWHSQTIRTFQPSLRSCRRTVRSRFLLRSSLLIQYLRLVEGIRCPLWQRCWCQKQPLTKMIFLREGKTRSGLPGRSCRCNLKRYPIEWSSFRTTSSGEVSCDRTRAMIWLLFSLLTVSKGSLLLRFEGGRYVKEKGLVCFHLSHTAVVLGKKVGEPMGKIR